MRLPGLQTPKQQTAYSIRSTQLDDTKRCTVSKKKQSKDLFLID